MLVFLLVMLIPLSVLIYTWSFGRWLKKKGGGAIGAYVIGAVSFGMSWLALWRVLA